jgi:hypothetical protein
MPPDKVLEVTFYVNFPDNKTLCYIAELAGFDPLNDGKDPSELLFKNVRLYSKSKKKFVWIANAYKGTLINKSNIILSHYNYRNIQDYSQQITWCKQPELDD